MVSCRLNWVRSGVSSRVDLVSVLYTALSLKYSIRSDKVPSVHMSVVGAVHPRDHCVSQGFNPLIPLNDEVPAKVEAWGSSVEN